MTLFAGILIFNSFNAAAAIGIVILALLLALSAFASASETSIFSLAPADIVEIKENPDSANKALLKLLSQPDYLLATILTLNNLANICAVILASNIINRLVTFQSSGAWEFVIKVVVVTFMLLLFGEIMPKIFATYNAKRFARFCARPLLVIGWLLKPFSRLLLGTGNLIRRRPQHKKAGLTIERISDAIEITKGQSEEEQQMLNEIVDFVNTDVEQIMRPRVDIQGIDIEEDFTAVKKIIIDSGYSRIPVYDQTIDNIKGVLYVKDMLRYIGEKEDFRWQEQLRKPYFVPEHKKINDLLVDFQTNKVHLGIVVDEYGSTLGLLSLEDILEEVVGEILDESDDEQATNYTRLDEHTYIFDGKSHIAQLTEVLGLDEHAFDMVKGEAETVAGLMLELKRDFVRRDESFTVAGVKFTAASITGRRIDKVKVELSATQDGALS